MTLTESGNALDCGYRGGHRGNIRDLIFNCRLADVRIVVFAESAGRCVDHQLNLAVFNCVHDIGTSFMHLQNPLRGNTVIGKKFISAFRGYDLKPNFGKSAGNFQDTAFVLFFHRD